MNSGWWVHALADRPVLLVSWIFWVILSITLHELAHGVVAIWQGDNTPIRLRRMTLNPIVHMGWMSLLMFALVGIAWGAMPVNPYKFRWGRRGDILVSGAGPATNVLLALISLTAAALWVQYGPDQEPLYHNVQQFLVIGGVLNLVLAAFNLLPVPPLDGSKIVAGLSRRVEQFYQSPQSQMVGMFVVMVLFISGIGGLFFAAADEICDQYLHAVRSILP